MKKNHGFITVLLIPLLLFGHSIFGQGIEIETGGNIVISGAATVEINNGNFINNGTYTKATETFTFSGNTADTISGSSTTVFNNLVITNIIGTSILSGTAVTATNLTTAGGTFIINSDATNNGSLIVTGTSTGNLTYNRYITGVDKWHLISSPVASQDINAFVVTDVGSNAVAAIDPKYGLAPYNNTTPGWNHYSTAAGGNDVAAAGNFVAGKGYEVLRTGNGTISFTGTVATDNVDIAISKNTNGWNLVGNPFTAAIGGNEDGISSSDFLTTNLSQLDASYGAIYVWDAENSNYITVTQDYLSNTPFYVAPGQAFFVYSKDGGGNVSFTEAMQTHQTSNIFKSEKIQIPAINLIAESSASTTSTHVKYIDNMTTGLDPGYDAGRFSGGDNSFAVYTHLVGDETNLVDFDIQCLPNGEFDRIIPVGLNAPENTEVVFRAEALNLPANVPVYLEDKVTGIYTALHEPGSFYTINTVAKTEGTARFFLHTKSSATGIDPIANGSDFTIITRPQNNSLRLIGLFGNNAEIAVYDMAGRKLLHKNLNDTEINDVDMGGLISGFYLVSVRSASQKVSKKISWSKNQ